MPLELIVDSLDSVDDAAKSLYVERNGKFHLDVTGPPPPDTTRLTSALERERKARADAEARLKTFNGVDPERYQQLLKDADERAAAEAERERKAAEARGEYERLSKEREEAHRRALAGETDKWQKQLAERDAQMSGLRAAMQRDKLETEAIRAITAARGVPQLLLPHIQSQARVVERNGQLIVEVTDGEQARTKTNGDLFTLTDLVEQMRHDPIYARAFEADGTRGTGSNGSGGSGTQGSLTVQQVEGMSMAEFRKARAEGRIPQSA